MFTAHAGVRYIPLRTPGGKSTSHVGLFVKIDIKELSFQDASTSGTCPLEFETSSKKISLPTVHEACEITADDHIASDEECNNEEHKSEITCWFKPNYRSLHQDAATCPVEIHVNW